MTAISGQFSPVDHPTRWGLPVGKSQCPSSVAEVALPPVDGDFFGEWGLL